MLGEQPVVVVEQADAGGQQGGIGVGLEEARHQIDQLRQCGDLVRLG
ncbi:Uncharacterised protein [Mycobacteroides abscessus subsp. abscessus]|nr:Uncharacterised protein [Mycobacteroides abscessus subsp. abscessus]